MTKQDKSSSRPGAGDQPRREQPRHDQLGRRNPGIEVVNIYGSGPVPVGLRTEAEPQAEDPGRERAEEEAVPRAPTGKRPAQARAKPSGSVAETKK